MKHSLMKEETNLLLLDFEVFINIRGEQLKQQILTICNYDQELANDTYSNACLLVIEKILQNEIAIDNFDSFYKWFIQQIKWRRVDIARDQKQYPMIYPDQIENEEGFCLWDFLSKSFTPSAEETFVDKEENVEISERLNKSILNLNPLQKEVVLQRLQGKKFEEIAEQSGESINTVLGRMRYALRRIRKDFNLC